MVGSILTAIFSKFTGSALSTALGGRMYSRFAPQNTVFPYATVTVATGQADWDFTSELIDWDVIFNIYSKSTSESEITTLLSSLLTLYDRCTLSISGSTFLYCYRDVVTSMAIPEEGIRQQSVIYNLMIKQ